MSFPVYPAPQYQYPQPLPYRAPVAAAPKVQPRPATPQAAKAVVPPPDVLGIRVEEVPFIEVPEPGKLGIKLD